MIRDPVIADHFAVHCDLHLQKPSFSKRTGTFRTLRSIDMDSVHENISNFNILNNPSEDLDALVKQYDSALCSILDKHAPIMQREVIVSPGRGFGEE
jgi:hypothetical protein